MISPSDKNPEFLYYNKMVIFFWTNPYKYSLKVLKERAECIADTWRQY